MLTNRQEVSEMLGGSLTNADEDEVEDELEALDAKMKGTPLPSVPTTELPAKERANAREEKRKLEADQLEERQTMLAA